jgi:hypothetical protein
VSTAGFHGVENVAAATGHVRFAARYQPKPVGRGKAAILAGRVLQVVLGNTSVRMTPAEAKAEAQKLMSLASKDPTVGLVYGYKPPGAKCERTVKLSQAEIRTGIESIYAACREAERAATITLTKGA